MTASCNKISSDSTGDSSDSKKSLTRKKTPQNTQIFTCTPLSPKEVRITCSTTATH